MNWLVCGDLFIVIWKVWFIEIIHYSIIHLLQSLDMEIKI